MRTFILVLSDRIARLERVLIGIFSVLMFGLVILGIFARYAGHSIYWIDEAAVYAMVGTSFVGASLVTRLKQEFAITLVLEYAPPGLRRFLHLAIAAISVGFAAVIVALTWRLFDPWTLVAEGFDVGRFGARTMNFVYVETTSTLGLPKVIFLLVLPLYAVALLVHTLANLIEAIAQAHHTPTDEVALEAPTVVG